MSKFETSIVVSDIHIPFQSTNCMKAVQAFISDTQPEGFIIAGDALDLLEISSHNKGSLALLEGMRIKDTFDAANAELDAFEKAGGKKFKKKKFMFGNHEDRMRRWIETGDHGVFAGDPAVNISERLHLKKRGFEVFEDSHATLKLGKLYVIHGEYCNQYHAAKHLNEFKHPVMYGHTHRAQMFIGPCATGATAAYGLGYLARPDSRGMAYAAAHGKRGWTQGFGVVTVRDSGRFNALQMQFDNGVFHYAGKMYGKEGAV